MNRSGPSPSPAPSSSRRRFLRLAGTLGAGGAVFGRALVALARESGGAEPVTLGQIRQAEWIAGIELTEDERKLMLDGVNELLGDFRRIREIPLDNAVAPALRFDPTPGAPPAPETRGRVIPDYAATPGRPSRDEDLAYAPVTRLASLLRTKKISSTELTRVYLERLKRLDPRLLCVVTLTEELALEQAAEADREIIAGRYRGPLHGIPWGSKDLLSLPGYPTTWGAMPYRDQVLGREATAVRRLREAGAVHLAKLSLGALAWGDVWFGGTTKNPWNTEQGSSGSSAGPASATAAGLVGFSIGSETWGSIVSPSTRCGTTGLRPTFGRVSRHGAMTLSWSMDKLGPITRSVEDCALVLDALHGADGLDPAAVDRPFSWPLGRDPKTLRVGYAASLFEEDRGADAEDEEERARAREWQSIDNRTLETLGEMGFPLVPFELPDEYPVSALSFILTAEASTVFDELTRSGRDDLLVRQIENAWPNVFRQGQLIPAVEYLRANRIRTLLMKEMERRMEGIDVYVCPSFGGDNLLLTNLTGHPCVVLPNGFRSDGTPTSITFMGKLFGEAEVLAVARAYQEETGFHLKRPPIG